MQDVLKRKLAHNVYSNNATGKTYILKYKAVSNLLFKCTHFAMCSLAVQEIRITNWSHDFPYKIIALFLQVKFIHGAWLLITNCKWYCILTVLKLTTCSVTKANCIDGK